MIPGTTACRFVQFRPVFAPAAALAALTLIVPLTPGVVTPTSAEPRPAVTHGCPTPGQPLRLVASADLGPYEWLDESGEPRGLNVAVARAVGRHLGVPVQIQMASWSVALQALESGAADLIAMAWTREREARYDFLASFLPLRISLVFPAHVAVPASTDDLSHLIVAAERDTVGHEMLRSMPPGRAPRLLLTTSRTETLRLVAAGTAQAAVGPGATLRWMANQGRRFDLPGELPVRGMEYWFATRKGCGPSLAAVGAAIDALRANGTLDSLVERHLAAPEERFLPHWVATAALVATGLLVVTWVWTLTLRAKVRRQTASLARALAEQQQLSRRAVESETRLKATLEAVDEGVWEWTRDGRLVVAERWLKTFWTDPDHVPRTTREWLEQVHPDDRDRVTTEQRRAAEHPAGTLEMTYRMRTDRGGYRWFLSRASVVARDEDGAPQRMIGIIRDVTREHEAEEALRAAKDAAEATARAKSAFLATMSHEMRTPLNAVIGTTSLLEATSLSPDQKELVSVLQRGSEVLLATVDDVLDFAKIEAGRLDLHLEPVELRPLASAALSLVEVTATAKRLQLRLDVAELVPAWVETDAVRLRQILLNLLSNAVKFTERGTVTLQIATDASGTGPLRFSVHDTGPGIPADQLEMLFEPFTQADLSSTRRHGGTGLGLAISRRLARLMGGEIEVVTAPGHGSTFTLSAPMPAVNPVAHPARPVVPVGRGSGGALRVLLAEDNTVNQFVVRRMLHQLGYACDVASNGREALEMYEREGYDLLLLDIQMPEMDGLECAREVLARGGQVRLVALTADVTTETRDACAAAGFDDFLTKPVRLDVLAAMLGRSRAALGTRWTLAG
ncbi:MAG: ATP-binding protein [Acidobacteriota bacterium]